MIRNRKQKDGIEPTRSERGLDPAAFDRLFRAYLRRQLRRYAASAERQAALWEALAIAPREVQKAVEELYVEEEGVASPQALLRWLLGPSRWMTILSRLLQLVPQVISEEEHCDASLLEETLAGN